MTIGRFYGGIFALIWSPEKEKYLLLKRSSAKDYASGVWACVTGRVDQGEGYAQALRREVFEELGVSVQFEFMLGTLHFYRGSEAPENELLGVACCCSLAYPERIQISAEHSEYRWVDLKDLASMQQEDAPSIQWISGLIQRAEAIRQRMPHELSQLFREAGLDLAG